MVDGSKTRSATACAMVIFGAAGDLTRRKLIPALYNLAKEQLLPRDFAIVGVSRTDFTSETFREKITEDIHKYADGAVDDELWSWLVRRLYHVKGEFDDPATYDKLKEALDKADTEHGTKGNYFYYLATAPNFFSVVVDHLGQTKLACETDSSWRRVIVEKPFGRDLDSARALTHELQKTLKEKQIYRIDHYLGKETVQNILAFRFANGIFEPIWNRRYIDHVQITVAESVGVEGRGGYYEEAGALRDMVPNHIMQLVSLVGMEPPVSFEANAVRDEQAKVLNAIQPFNPEDVLARTVRGQYGEGAMGSEQCPAYRAEPRVAATSKTETYVAMKLNIDNWRWAGVPFYLRTGKRMKERHTYISIQFRRAPKVLFRDTPVETLAPNILTLQIQPEEGISLQFAAKTPGSVMKLGTVDMEFNYADYFGKTPSTGYERLLHDCMAGDATLFQRADMVEAGWAIMTPVLDVWKALPVRNFPNYASGSWGPKEADDLLTRDERRWRNLES